jgi:hypothetical protein
MEKKRINAIKKYKKANPKKARIISQAVKRGVKQYAETFRRLAST